MSLYGVVIALFAILSVWWWRTRGGSSATKRRSSNPLPTAQPPPSPPPKAKAGDSILAGVSDAGTAAAVLLYGLAAAKGSVGPDEEERIERLLETVCRMSARDRTEAMAFASWAAGHISDPDEIRRRLMPLWSLALGETERRDLIGMCEEIIEMDGPSTEAQRSAVRRLTQGLFQSEA